SGRAENAHYHLIPDGAWTREAGGPRPRSTRSWYMGGVTFGVLALLVAAGLAGPVLAAGGPSLVPVIVGELLAGVVIGRSGFGWLDPGEPTGAFPGQGRVAKSQV